ncbi:MAG: hypothetical protein KGL74_09470 [Elusimicrobia bacterium]|nr:hypothetical protein [Elusimicrobiota bacterium]
MPDNTPLSIATALAAQLNSAGGDYAARAAKGAAGALLVPKSDASKAVGLIVRSIETETAAEGAAQAVGVKLKGASAKRTGVLTVLARKTPTHADAAALALGVEKVLSALDQAGAGPGGLKILDTPPAGSGFEYASWSPQPESLTVELLYRTAAEIAEVRTEGASAHWLALILPNDRRPLVRAVAVKMPEGDAIKRLWWAFPEKDGWSFLPF